MMAGKACGADLFEAAARGDAAEVKKLVTDGANINAAGSDGKTVLHLAVEKGNHDLAKLLIELGADAAKRDSRGFSSFFIASVVKRDMPLTAVLMKTQDNSAKAAPYLLVDFGSRPEPKSFSDTASLVQWNPRFGYRFVASPDWGLFNVRQDGLHNKQSLVVMTLPAVWGDVEQQNIENAISVFAVDDGQATSLEKAVTDFWKNHTVEGVVGENRRVVSSDEKRHVVDFDQKEGQVLYKRRGVVLFRNGVSYNIVFTATPGTFEKNLKVFSAFCDSIQFADPEREHVK